MIRGKVVAVDFDGTITKNLPFPQIELREGARETIEYIRKNNVVALWTCRCGEWLDEALRVLRENGFIFDSVNCLQESFRDEPRKIGADIFIDDRNIFCRDVDWAKIREFFEEEE